MRSYVKDLLLSLNWPMPKKPQLSPFTTAPIAYGQKTQFTPDKDTSAPLLPKCLKCIQKSFWSLLFYARAVNNKLLVALNGISAQQAKAMVHTEQLVKTLLNYVATYPNDGIVYRVSVDPLVSGDGQTISYQPHIHANTIRRSREQHRCSHNL